MGGRGPETIYAGRVPDMEEKRAGLGPPGIRTTPKNVRPLHVRHTQLLQTPPNKRGKRRLQQQDKPREKKSPRIPRHRILQTKNPKNMRPITHTPNLEKNQY